MKHKQSRRRQGAADPAYSGEIRARCDTAAPMPLNIRKIIARRAALELQAISSALVESAVNQLIDKRMSKSQQMRWDPRSAHLLLQVRVRVIDGQLRDDFARWYPGFPALDPHQLNRSPVDASLFALKSNRPLRGWPNDAPHRTRVTTGPLRLASQWTSRPACSQARQVPRCK